LPSSFHTHPPTPQLSPLSLHDALPIYDLRQRIEQGKLFVREERRRRGCRRQLLRQSLGNSKRCRQGRRRSELENIASSLHRFPLDRKSTRLNSSHRTISYAVFCLKKK